MWLDLKERLSQRNGPRIFQLQKVISAHSQGNASMSFYYTKLKGLWDELIKYRPIPKYSYGSSKSTMEYHHKCSHSTQVSTAPGSQDKGSEEAANKSYIRHSTFDGTSSSTASAAVCSCQLEWQTKEEQIKALQEKAAEAQ